VIPVEEQHEPSSFNRLVRQRGLRFIAKNPRPTSKQFGRHDYWKAIAKDLHAAYKGICAYRCVYLVEGDFSVDHFLPKSRHPVHAYEWKNYRLAGGRVNRHKDNCEGIVDPFNLESGWFVLDFPSCLVRPSDHLTEEQRNLVERTISVLKLNDDDSFVQDRCDLMVDYSKKNVTHDYLSRRYPFLAVEIERQGIQDTVQMLFKSRTI
jgi:hypothetical protein